ncbi:MAG TPA: PQQ-binding-like beta-propeller repeat protein, partial [Anaeromyxobacteraceae bacterium]|nr:PQQ-binding-like beta-propeller repeat protein [Anaeromyxobacteraceae bacterium]
AIDGAGGVYGATSTLALKAIRRQVWDGEAFAASWIVDVGEEVNAPLVVAAPESIISGSSAGEVERSYAGSGSGALAALRTLTGRVDDSPIILSNGDIVVGDAGGKLHRLASDGTAVWGAPADLGAAVHAPLALAAAAPGAARFLVATADGKVHALDDDGTILWSGPLTSGLALGAGNLHTPAGAPLAPDGSPFSTAYFAGADGTLYAVIVEGALDTSAPWPKAWHDARNTSRAGGAF